MSQLIPLYIAGALCPRGEEQETHTVCRKHKVCVCAPLPSKPKNSTLESRQAL